MRRTEQAMSAMESDERGETDRNDAAELARPIFDRLAELEIASRTHWHEPVFTVEESRALRGQIRGVHTKNLFLKDRKGGHFLLVCREDAVVDLKTIHLALGARGRVSFGGAEAMRELLGVSPGSVTAFAAMNDHGGRVTVAIDAALLDVEEVNCHPLTNAATTTLAASSLLTFLQSSGHPPLVVDLTQAAPGGAELEQRS